MRFFFFLQSAAFIASATSTLLLTDIYPLPAGSVTPGCLSTYSAEIPQCPSAAELSGDPSCTDECVSGLKTIAASIIVACRQMAPSPGSLLEAIMQGDIEQAICGGSGGGGGGGPNPTTPTAPTPGTVGPTPIFSGVSTILRPSVPAPALTSLVLDSQPLPSYSGEDASFSAEYTWLSESTNSPVPSRSATQSASPSSSDVSGGASRGRVVGGGMVAWIGVVLAAMLA